MKVPCGGFDLDESVFNVDKNSKQVKLNSPISYDYMPEGYPKKDGWSIVWDGNTEGKVAAVGAQFYKISDMMPTYDDLWSATLTPIGLPGDPAAVSDLGMTEIKASDNITAFIIGSKYLLYVISENNASAEGATFPQKGTYGMSGPGYFKLSVGSGVITPMSADFIPKNLNVVFKAETGNLPTSCNVTYNELRGWVENGIPVFAVLNIGNNHEVYILGYMIISEGYIIFGENSGASKKFKYNSDGTFSGATES